MSRGAAAATLAWTLCGLAATTRAQAPSQFGTNCSTAGCHDDLSKRPVVHAPLVGNNCDACHEQQEGDAHKFRLTSDTPTLCAECHEKFEGKTVHQPVGAGQCTACHDPHSSAAKGLLVAGTVGDLCRECHENVGQDRRFVHGPMAAGDCTVCHQAHASDHPGLLVATERKLCLDCHDEMQDRLDEAKTTHQPVGDGCTSCHDPHAAEVKSLLNSTQPGLCVDCHEDVGTIAAEAAHRHSPTTNGPACGNCHDPHASSHGGLLLGASKDLCLRCHNQELATGERTLVNVGKLLKDAAQHHGPIQQGDCGGCHSPHGADHSHLLVKPYAEKFYQPYTEESYALCFECHDAAAFNDERTDSATEFRNGDRNLHFVHVNRTTKGRSCRACHDVHATTGPKHVVESVPFGNWRIPLKFKATATGGSCMTGCHQTFRYDRETPVVRGLRP